MVEKKNPQYTTTITDEDQKENMDDTTTAQGLSAKNHLDDSTIYDNMIFPS